MTTDQEMAALAEIYPPKHPKSPFPLWRPQEAAELLNVSVSWLHAESSCGRFPYVQLSAGRTSPEGRGTKRFRNDHIHRWLDERTVG